MSDFITMQCPSCGGKLAVAGNALSLKCEHCGTEHIIRRDAGGIVLESYARCPICNRNDKAEKVTAILRSQTRNVQGVSVQNRTVNVRVGNTYQPVVQQIAVPTETAETSELARRLAPPPQPNPGHNLPVNAGRSHWITIIAIVLLLVGGGSLLLLCPVLLNAVGTVQQNGSDTPGAIAASVFCSAITFIPVLISILLFIYAVPRERKKNQEKKAAAAAKLQALQAAADDQNNRWQRAMKRWNRLYYCGRDDCVFLPGANTCASITQMWEYLCSS